MSSDSLPLRSLTPEAFRKAAYQHADWIAGYLENVRDFPVTTAVRPGDLTKSLPMAAPDRGESIEEIFRDFKS